MPEMSYDKADEKRGYMEVSEERTTVDNDQIQNNRRVLGDDAYENANFENEFDED